MGKVASFLLRSKVFWGTLWVLCMGVIFYFSNMPGSPTWYEPTFSYIIERKSAHVAEYMALTLISIQFFSLLFLREALGKILWLALFWSFGYAASDELHQFFTPFRGAKIADIGVDMIGTLFVIAPLALYLYSRNKK